MGRVVLLTATLMVMALAASAGVPRFFLPWSYGYEDLRLWSYGSEDVQHPGYCDFLCTLHVQQLVCGTDGVTYVNLCFLHLAACRVNSSIAFDHWGECLGASGDQPGHKAL
ncbi:uncharacterized protein [Panulirus ornatus]|uniref:uncharacterized protein n=1 Tax=Panulirus ornatus TaxID=150431 RepID=UPI003A84D833